MNHRIVLSVMSGPDDGKVLELTAQGKPPEISFGRLDTCTVLLLEDPEVSRLHAKIVGSDNRLLLEDCGSSNGTFIGEFAQAKKIDRPVPLKEGDFFRVGRTRFRLESNNFAINDAQACNQAQY